MTRWTCGERALAMRSRSPLSFDLAVEVKEEADPRGVEELELAQIEHDPGGVAVLGAAHLAIDAADHREVQLAEQMDPLVAARAHAAHGEAPRVHLACALVPL